MQRTEIPVFALPRVLDAVRRRFDYVFDTSYSYPGLPKITLQELNVGAAEIAGIPVQVISVMHGTLPVLGFRIAGFCYITDAKEIPEDQFQYLQDLDVLILNALHHKAHFSHYNLKEALEVIRVISPRKAFLTHLSHDMGLHQEIESSLPPDVYLAYDGMQLSVGT
jgi:phosphoribosyl 1,2-cyclic phosphate phosphodiesterase